MVYMGYQVKESSYQTCACGKVCKGRAALANHGRKCETERVYMAALNWAMDNNLRPMNAATLRDNYDAVVAALTARGAL